MQIPPFDSLCKYGFWSHERMHSILNNNFRPCAGVQAHYLWHYCKTAFLSLGRGYVYKFTGGTVWEAFGLLKCLFLLCLLEDDWFII